MAFNNNPGKQSFTATGGQTEFDFNFKIYADIDLKVYLTPDGQDPNDTTDILTLNTDYTVVVDGDDGGTITLTSGATVDDTIVIARDLDATRDISYVTNGDLKAATLNLDQDYQTYLIIDGYVALLNAVQLPQSAVDVDPVLPNVRPDSYLKWNSLGTALENDETIPDAVIDAAASAAAALVSENAAAESASAASTSANDAQLREWEAEAWRLTADSYANEAEDVPVNIVTSDGDGTFTYTPTSPAEYSALHWAAKAEAVASLEWGGIGGNLEDQTDLVSQLVGFKNIIINGDKRVNQRGYSGGVLADGVYGYDRWKGADSDANIEQIIEQQNIISGTYTITFTGGGTATVAGTSGLASGDDVVVTVAGDISVKVPKGASNIQLESGSVATPFELRPYGLELSLCRRYYKYIYSGGNNVVYERRYWSGSGNNFIATLGFGEAMRVAPTAIVTWTTNMTGISLTTLVTGGATLYGASVAGDCYIFTQLLILDAEL